MVPLAAAALLMPWLAARGLEIDLRGTVTDSDGTPLSKATVTLRKREISAATDSSGTFRLQWSSPVLPGQVGNAGRGPALRNGLLSFAEPSTGIPVRLTVCDLAGRVTFSDRINRGAAGWTSIDVRPVLGAEGVRLLTLRIGNRPVFHARVALATGLTAATAATVSPPAMSHLASEHADALDSLLVSRPGYHATAVPIHSYTDSLHVQLSRRNTVSFSVNRGVRYIATPACSLFVVDSSDIVASVRFTQVADSLPRFGADDELNAVRSMVVDQPVSARPWVLPQGGERKFVYAELAFRDTSRALDTIRTFVDIAPWTAHIRFAGSSAVAVVRDTVMRHGETSVESTLVMKVDGAPDAEIVSLERCPFSYVPCYQEHTLHTRSPRFTVDRAGDTTFADTFTYWVVTPAANDVLADSGLWLETVPRTGVLAAAIAQDSTTVYTYDLSTETAEGRENLQCLRMIDDSAQYPETEEIERLCGDADSNAVLFGYLTPPEAISPGRKEIMVVARFTGRFFGEQRYVLTRARTRIASMWWQYRATCIDWYQPSCEVHWSPSSSSGYVRMYDGARVGSSLDYYVLVRDRGYAPPAAVSVVIATKPPGFVPGPDAWTITLDDLLSRPHEIIDIPVDQLQTTYRPESLYLNTWYDGTVYQPHLVSTPMLIDTRQWASGEYVCATVTEDTFGNTGFGMCPTLFYVEGGIQ